MHKKFIIILSIFAFLSTSANTDENIIKNLKSGGNIVFIRHAVAPGSGDPKNFRLNDCATQRNLDNQGIKQSKNITSPGEVKQGTKFMSFSKFSSIGES